MLGRGHYESLFLAKKGSEDIWKGVPKFCLPKGKGDEK